MSDASVLAPPPAPQPPADATAIMALLRAGETGAAVATAASARADGDGAGVRAAHGVALLASGRDAEAVAALSDAVAHGDGSRVTALNLALAIGRTGDVQRAEALIGDLAERFPDWDEPPLRLAESLRGRGCQRGAETAYQAAIATNPGRVEALLGLAGLLMARGSFTAGRDLARRCCVIEPRRAEAWDALGVGFLLAGDAPHAEAAFARAQDLAPGDLKIAIRRIEAACRAGTAPAELARLEVAASADPLNVTLLAARAALLERTGCPEEAIELLEAARALWPDSADMARMLALVLMNTGHVHRAEAALRRARQLAPDDLVLRRNHPPALLRLQRHREARDILQALLAEHGETAGDLGNLSMALTALGLQAQGVAAARRAIALDPGAHFGWRILCSALPYDETVTGTELSAAYRACGTRATRERDPSSITFDTIDADPERRIRVGLLSMDLRSHPSGWLTVAGFEMLDKAAFEIICFAQPESAEVVQRRFRAVASEWHVMNPSDRDDVVRRVREASIDVLVELGGYGDRGMLITCARRLAPVQIKWVGAQNHTTGLDEMDWFITDQWETPPELEHLYTERLLRLPDGYVCYSPPTYAPDVAPLPASRTGHMTFGCFNNLAKITPRALATWSRILRRVPGSRLIVKAHALSDAETRDEVHGRFTEFGIHADSIELRGGSIHRTLLAEYGDIDIALDPFPYSGGLTTCEALWMGVPTVTLPGETFSSRHSTSHMSNVGLSDWVARDLAEYEAIAVARAADPRALSILRAGLRSRVRASPLCDAPRFGSGLGAALRLAWRDWCHRRGAAA